MLSPVKRGARVTAQTHPQLIIGPGLSFLSLPGFPLFPWVLFRSEAQITWNMQRKDFPPEGFQV